MTSKSLYRSGLLLFLLAAVLGACAPQTVTAEPTSASESTHISTQVTQQAALALLTLEQFGFRFRYPAQYQTVIGQKGLCLSPAQEYGPPGPCHVQNLGIDVQDAQGRTLEDAAEEAAARGNPDVEVKRTPITVGGQPAILLDDIYSVDVLRIVVVVYNGRIYQLTFVPWADDPAADSPLGILYNTVIDSFEFLDTAPAPETSSNLTFTAAETFASISPDGDWHAEAVVIQFVEKDYARLKLYRQENNTFVEFTPYEEWSETGLGDSFLSELIWSPDGRYLYFTHRGNADGCGDPFVTNLRRVDLQSGALSEIPLTGINLDVITLSPQADRLAYRTADGFVIRSLDTGETVTIPYTWREEHDYLVSSYAWSPDGRRLAFTLTQEYCLPDPGEASGTSIRYIFLDTGEEQILTDRDPRFLVVTGWPDDGTLQVNQDGNPYRFDIATGALTPDPAPAP
jgi:hypothetical protein